MTYYPELEKIVNKSGFPLQIGIETLVQTFTDQHGWKVLYAEHSWKNPLDGRSGFVDLVLENNPQTIVLVIECKRVQDLSLIFLNPDGQVATQRYAKAWLTRTGDGKFTHFDWYDLTLDPATPQSQYCIVSANRLMLEHVASELVSATEAIAWEEKPIHVHRLSACRIYCSVIVTTAALKICSFKPGQISLRDGKVSASVFSDESAVRFRKQLSTLTADNATSAYETPGPLVAARERTVFVVNAEKFIDFLSKFDIDNPGLF